VNLTERRWWLLCRRRQRARCSSQEGCAGGGLGAVHGRGQHHSSMKACDPEITGSRLIGSAVCVSCWVAAHDRRLPCVQGLIVLLMASNGK